MINEIYKNDKKNFDAKEMYSKLALLTNTNKMTDILNPGESFIISNQ